MDLSPSATSTHVRESSTSVFSEPASSTRLSGTTDRPGYLYDPMLSELSSPPSSGAAGDDASAESLVQPNRRFTSLETAKELEGRLEVPDRPEISAGYADVYHGVWTNVDGNRVQVAVKEFRTLVPRTRQSDPEELRRRTDTRIRREVFVWSQTKHPNLHPLLGYLSQPQPRLISPWCRHGNLTDYLRERPGLSRSHKLRLVYQTACGLAYLHSQTPPICHADIKPENILVNDRHEAALSDFGLSRVLEGLGVPSGFTTTERVKGTLNYMASELFEGEKPNLESDVYAFGGLILTVMSGKPPFTGLREPIVMRRIIQSQLPRPEDHPDISSSDPLWRLMGRCWHKTPQERPAIMEVQVELSEDPSHRRFVQWPSSSSQTVVATAPSEDACPESVADVELHQKVMPDKQPPSEGLLPAVEPSPPLPFLWFPELPTTEEPEDLETLPQKQQSSSEKPLPKMPSQSILSTAEKAKVKSAFPEDWNKILYATPVRIYYAHPDPNRWTYIGQEGALALVANKIKEEFWFRMIDLKGSRGITWEHEVYDDFIYYQDRPFFHSFPGDSCMIGFSFAYEKDANMFFKKLNGRTSKTSKSKGTVKNKSGKPGKIDKSMISAPTNFKHVAHMGWSEDTGFSSRGVDESWSALIGGLERFGITEKQFKENEKFVQQFVEKARMEGLDAANKAYAVPNAPS